MTEEIEALDKSSSSPPSLPSPPFPSVNVAVGVAVGVVAAGACDRVTLQVSYAIGVVQPTSIMVDTHGTGKVDEEKIEKCVKELFDLSPKGIIDSLDLLRPIYRKTASYGHFGREEDGFTWELTNRAEDIKEYLSI